MMSEQLDPRLMLKQALVKERMLSFELATLEYNFYEVIREWLQTLSGEDSSAMSTLLSTLGLLRKNKLTALAVAVNIDPDIRAKMTTEDRSYFDAVANATIEFKKSVEID